MLAVDPQVPADPQRGADDGGVQDAAGQHEPRVDADPLARRHQHERVEHADVVGGHQQRPSPQLRGDPAGDGQPPDQVHQPPVDVQHGAPDGGGTARRFVGAQREHGQSMADADFTRLRDG